MASNRFSRVATHEGEETDVEVEESPLSERWRIWKNVLALGLAFMMHYTAIWGATNLQSSINIDKALGTSTLAISSGSIILSNIFLPAIFIKYLGCKWTLPISLMAGMPYILSQFYPRFYTMIPAGLAAGLVVGPLWCAMSTYLTVIAERYSQIVGVSSDVIVTRFFGMFFTFYQLSQVWGNFISSTVLSITESENSTQGHATKIAPKLTKKVLTSLDSWDTMNMFSFNETITIVNMCGANFQPNQIIQTGNPNWTPPPMHKIQLIVGIYFACQIVGCLIVVFFVDSLTKYDKGRTSSGSKLSGVKLLAVTMKQLGNPFQLLILPISMFIGVQHSFLVADYTASFLSCGWGIQNIGYVMICYGVCNAISSLCTGSIVKITGRPPLIAFALLIHIGLIVTLQMWTPTSANTHTYFIVAGLWGVAEAVWLVQIRSLYAILFPGQEEASFSNIFLWDATGAVISFTYYPLLRTSVKLYLVLGILLIGVTGYAIIEWLKRRETKDRIISEKNHFKLDYEMTMSIGQ